MIGLLLLLFSLLLHHAITHLFILVITKMFPTTPTMDILYAANWLVSLVQAVMTTLAGVVFCWQSDLVLMNTKLSLLYPYGWLSLGYWLYDLTTLAMLANKTTPVTDMTGRYRVVRRAAGQVVTLVRWSLLSGGGQVWCVIMQGLSPSYGWLSSTQAGRGGTA